MDACELGYNEHLLQSYCFLNSCITYFLNFQIYLIAELYKDDLKIYNFDIRRLINSSSISGLILFHK